MITKASLSGMFEEHRLAVSVYGKMHYVKTDQLYSDDAAGLCRLRKKSVQR